MQHAQRWDNKLHAKAVQDMKNFVKIQFQEYSKPNSNPSSSPSHFEIERETRDSLVDGSSNFGNLLPNYKKCKTKLLISFKATIGQEQH